MKNITRRTLSPQGAGDSLRDVPDIGARLNLALNDCRGELPADDAPLLDVVTDLCNPIPYGPSAWQLRTIEVH